MTLELWALIAAAGVGAAILFGLAPMVISPGAGSELYRGLGAVLLGGLLFSTVFTLVVVPAMFTLFLDFQTWLRTALSPSTIPSVSRLPTPMPAPAASP